MSATPDRIKVLISNIDEALSLSNPRPPLVVAGDSIVQSRRVLEQVRSYLLSLESSRHDDNSDIIPRYCDRERQLLEQSLRSIVREELRELQTPFAETIQAEIKAMRQERRALIRELRWLRQQRQQTPTPQQTTQQATPPSRPASAPSPVTPQIPTYIYPSQHKQAPELFPYAGVELPPSTKFEADVGVVSFPPENTESQTSEPDAIAPTPPATSAQEVNSDRGNEINPHSSKAQEQLESVAPELEIATTSQTGQSISTSPEPENPTQDHPAALESVAPELEIATNSNSQEPPPKLTDRTPTVVSLNQDPTAEENPLKNLRDRGDDSNDNIFGVFDLGESVLESQPFPPSSVTPATAQTSPDPIHELLDREGYIHASPHEDLLPRYQEDDRDQDQLDSHLMVGKSIRQQLEEDLANLEQQSFIGEENPTSDFSDVANEAEDAQNPLDSPTPTSKPPQNPKVVKTFEDLWSQTSPVEVNPFAEASASEMTLDEILATIDEDEVKTKNPENKSDLDDLNFEALNRKLQD